ncbi:MAG: hypothetical protein A2534_00885 [Candidatus Magasanikbacteria bacterium RIFOXYD2_FULL_39_9]|uniref:DUF1761 domain-containing protein n=1 Tax=Candidatus Magasanikbacteria bacterium RIFOXYD1_FULL_40_23 TaxID=1798705 RepID=A0A1F6P7K0_9BACT|nr:MAG: hypothetical protein A2563_01015 [Candidatus Magasanikbacteria bacterium RIFOXYD1_FULL_40_23]OGH93540.1 MAG: hypothetical protein A2534_00885 [Candidatus Magasanikbacteria bacterium RIFOXYD2_FULL_39_9]
MWPSVDFLPVLVAAVASMVIGSIWYGPLFGKKFMVAMGMDKWTPEQQVAMKKKMWMSYVGQFVASLVMFYVLAGITYNFVYSFAQGGWAKGAMVGFIMWVGFVLPLKVGDVLWGGNKTLFWLESLNMLITLLAAGAIIGTSLYFI